MGKHNDITTASVELDTKDGVAFIEQASPLTRLHYFDGKFLKADALAQEQSYHRTQVRLANLAGGWGVVHGLGVRLQGDQLQVTGGLAVTPAGSFVMAVGEVQASIAELLKVAAPAPAVEGQAAFGPCSGTSPAKGVTETGALGLYEITVGPIEGLCGNEPVYGALCESACVSDSRHPWWREGLVLRLRPVTLQLPVSTTVAFSTTHLRNRVASAYFASEPGATEPALGASGLASDVWCQPASLYGRDEVVIGLLAREAGVNRFIDLWAGRRERMDTQARGFWQGRMAMRPWNVFLAQILQFQCQLSGVFDDTSVVVPQPDSCDNLRAALEATRKELQALQKKYAESAGRIVDRLGGRTSKADAQKIADEVKTSSQELFELSEKLSGLDVGQGALPKHRLLLNNGFVQLPPAGYLPVQTGKTELSDQLSRMFGEGVRLTYRAARADVLPHLLEEAQHMERISLTRGLDHPQAIEDVEIFVPDGRVVDTAAEAPGVWWDTGLSPVALLLTRFINTSLDEEGQDTLTGNDTMMSAHASASPQHVLNLLRSRAATAQVGLQQSALDRLDDLSHEGLTRTEARDDGSYALTLVAGTDPDAVQQVLAQAQTVEAQAASVELKKGRRAKADTQAALMVNRIEAPTPVQASPRQAVYLAGDLAGDPFALSQGDELAFKGELRLLTTSRKRITMGVDARAQGTLRLIGRQLQSGGRTVLVVELDGTMAVSIHVNGQTLKDQQSHIKTRVGLVRRGDGDVGTLLIDDPQFDADSAPVTIEWDDQPREVRVTLSTQLDAKASVLGTTGSPDAAQTLTLAHLRALPAAPAAGSALGAASLNQLTALAEATLDAAFPVRARRRLFPVLDASGVQRIVPLHDWVMFRRLRPTFCNPVCATPVQTTQETFELWHARVDSPKQLKALSSALEQGHADAIAAFKFQRVGVLRYRDDQTQSEESATQVRALWAPVAMGGEVQLARAWETRPTAGQGWQNHFRLRAMLDLIGDLVTPPSQGDGRVGSLQVPPAPLTQGGFDGGFLVVTGGQAVSTTHRVLLMDNGTWADAEPGLQRSPAEGWKDLQDLVTNDASSMLDLTLKVQDNQLSSAQIAELQDADAKMRQMIGGDNPVDRMAVRVEAASLSVGEDAVRQTEGVAKAVEARLSTQSFVITTESDLGEGAHVLTVIVYDVIHPQ